MLVSPVFKVWFRCLHTASSQSPWPGKVFFLVFCHPALNEISNRWSRTLAHIQNFHQIDLILISKHIHLIYLRLNISQHANFSFSVPSIRSLYVVVFFSLPTISFSVMWFVVSLLRWNLHYYIHLCGNTVLIFVYVYQGVQVRSHTHLSFTVSIAIHHTHDMIKRAYIRIANDPQTFFIITGFNHVYTVLPHSSHS